MLDTIAGFTVMFAAVTAVAAWILTSSPRLSYFGNQLALAFYLIQLHGPSPQTNLAIARDNIMGILLGLLMMWLVFETFGSKPAVQVMRELFAENLHLMAQLASPWPQGKPADLQKIRTLREKISQNFFGVTAQADAVLFEIGRSRDHSLAVRDACLAGYLNSVPSFCWRLRFCSSGCRSLRGICLPPCCAPRRASTVKCAHCSKESRAPFYSKTRRASRTTFRWLTPIWSARYSTLIITSHLPVRGQSLDLFPDDRTGMSAPCGDQGSPFLWAANATDVMHHLRDSTAAADASQHHRRMIHIRQHGLAAGKIPPDEALEHQRSILATGG